MRLPSPIIIDPSSVPSLRWGIIGPGNIAEVFVESSQKHTRQTFSAVASRTQGRAEAFAKQFGIPTVHENYDQLVQDPNLDAVYIASWQVEHFEHAMLALNAGKHVLVEKPITVLPEHAEQIFALAKQKGLLAIGQSQAVQHLFIGSIEFFGAIQADQQNVIANLKSDFGRR